MSKLEKSLKNIYIYIYTHKSQPWFDSLWFINLVNITEEIFFLMLSYVYIRIVYNIYIYMWIYWSFTWFSHENASILIKFCLDNALCIVERKLGHYILVQQTIIYFTSYLYIYMLLNWFRLYYFKKKYLTVYSEEQNKTKIIWNIIGKKDSPFS